MWWKIVLVVLLLLGGYGIYRIATTPQPGTRMEDLGRDHVPVDQVESTQYNSNPPTSGPHVVTWVKPGVYDKPQHDGELIHSLEHGYIVISYNCNVQSGSSDAATNIATGSAVNESDSCTSLVSQLTDLANRKKLFKLVVVPRLKNDSTIALAAWTYIDKLDAFDAARIEKFIDYHRNHGPEQTME